ncbi:MAG: hypothetical protein U9N44_05395 [Chloroflexota bacterium]|nr:hypothetical protein [Chloroflexota bacterium]
MRDKQRLGVLVSAALTLVLLLSLAVSLAAVPVEAHAPSGAGDPAEFEMDDIWIYDVDGGPLKISIDDAAGAHEGGLCPCVAAAFRVTQAAIGELWDLEEEYPSQGELLVTCRHPSKGYKDVFEYILTEGSCTFELPEGTSIENITMDNYVYTFTRTDTEDELNIQLNASVVPDGFFDIRYKVKGYDKGWHNDNPTGNERDTFVSKWSEFRDNLLTMEAWELFDGIDEGVEEFPTAGVAFTGILACLLLLGGVYSLRGKVRRK